MDRLTFNPYGCYLCVVYLIHRELSEDWGLYALDRLMEEFEPGQEPGMSRVDCYVLHI